MQRFIVLEGLIGVGKTSLARLLERRWGARLVLEPAETNPFLEPFYRNPAKYALPVQMYYLLTRWRQQDQIAQGDLFQDLIVSDYLFSKDRLFAEKTLQPSELDVYDRIASTLGVHSPTPDLIVFLDAPTEVILGRIAQRAAAGEDVIQAEYLDDLRRRYHLLLSAWTACPVLFLSNRDMDYTTDPAARQMVLEKIRAAMPGGVKEAPGSPMWDREDVPSLFGSVAQPMEDDP